jgi:hypothetical protein
MKNILISLLLLIGIDSNCQIQMPTPYDVRVAIANSQCVHSEKLTAKKRLSFYPFNKATKILVISYNDKNKIQNSIPLKNKQIIFSEIRELDSLPKSQIDSLTNILFNTGYKSKSKFRVIEDKKCYNPRNAILFLNKKNEVFEYIEICFECNKRVLSSEKIKDGEYCNEKFDLLWSFFQSMGIEVGLNRR